MAVPSLTKAEAAYTDKAKTSEHCGNCSMFRRPKSCTLVRGDVKAAGWCRHWRHQTLQAMRR